VLAADEMEVEIGVVRSLVSDSNAPESLLRYARLLCVPTIAAAPKRLECLAHSNRKPLETKNCDVNAG
jgi:hypothetical protein